MTINAFGVHASIATRHEAKIGAVMQAFEAHRGTPSLPWNFTSPADSAQDRSAALCEAVFDVICNHGPIQRNDIFLILKRRGWNIVLDTVSNHTSKLYVTGVVKKERRAHNHVYWTKA